MLTNRLGLPDTIVRAVTHDPYSSAGSNISATSLYGAPRPRVLRQRYPDAAVEDVSDRLWALVGQIGHGILERAIFTRNAHETLEEIRDVAAKAWETEEGGLLAEVQRSVDAYFREAEQGDIVERRLFAPVLGWIVSGQVDVVRQGEVKKIQDYKFTSTWTWVYGGRKEWEYQLNTYAWLQRMNGGDVDALEIVAIFRDWRKAEAQSNPEYPQAQGIVIPIPLWTLEEQQRWIEERVRIHQLAELTPTEDLPRCTDEERWVRDAQWVVTKPDAKRATAIVESEQAGLDLIEARGEAGKGLAVIYRPGRPIRCESYCDVSSVCPQWRRSYQSLFSKPVAIPATKEEG